MSPAPTNRGCRCMQGSTVARQASEKERAKDLPTYKDNDFLNDRKEISVGPEKRAVLMKTLQADTEVGRRTSCWLSRVIVVTCLNLSILSLL